MQEILTEKNFQRQAENAPSSRIVKFTNFSKEDFVYTLNNIPYTFNAGDHKYMEEGIARHFAKHLVNRELLKRGHENDTSPKDPKSNPFFMELYNRCISSVEQDGSPTDQTKLAQDAIDLNMKEERHEHVADSAEDSHPENPIKSDGKEGEKKSGDGEGEFEELKGPDASED